MAEVEADSTGTTEAVSDEGFDLGADLEESATATSTESPATDSTSADAGTPDFDPNTVDIGTADPESLPASYRDAQSWAQKRERELQADYTRKTQAAADYRRQLETLQTQLATQQAQQSANGQPAKADPLADLRQRLGEDGAAVDTVSEIVKAVNADASAQQATHQQQLANLQTHVQALTQVMSANQTSGLNQQVVEAREAYGNQLDAYADQIKALLPVSNPVTKQAYTVKEAFEVLAGKAQEKSQELAATDRQIRSDASNRTAINGAVGAANTDGGDLSAAQLQAGLKALGFE